MPEDEEVEKPEEDGGDSASDNGDDPPGGEGLSEEVFVVAKILEHMVDADGILFFKVRWENYGPDDDSWEPSDNLGSAKERIEAYWAEEAKNPKTKKTKEKKKTKQSKSTSSGSTSRSRGRKSSPKVERPKTPETEPESEKSGSEDGEYESGKKKSKSKPVSKGALKAYDPPKRAGRKDKTPPLSTAKKAAYANRKSWLDSSDDSDDELKTEEKKEESVANDSAKNELNMKKEARTTETSSKSSKKNKKEKTEIQKESDTPDSSKRNKRGREEPLNEEEDEPSSKRDKKEEIRPPTPPKPSRYGPSSSSETPPPENIEYVEPEEEGTTKIVKMKIKLPLKPSARPCFKSKEKTTSDILYYNRWKKYKPLNEIKGLKEIDIVEGIMISEKGNWNIFVRDVDKTCCILTAEEAFEMCGWTLVQYLLARAKFC